MKLLVLLISLICLVFAQTSQETTSELTNDTDVDTLESSGTEPAAFPTSTTPLDSTPGVKTTTTPKSTPKPPSFTGWSFFLGVIVAILVLGLIGFACKFWRQKRAPNGVQYATYQAS